MGEHNPTIVFHLRQGVKFHDGHVFDAGDVKFTYESIMNPKNLSPRTPDFEPIKTVEILDPYTVKIIYKRLYSPGHQCLDDGDASRASSQRRRIGS